MRAKTPAPIIPLQYHYRYTNACHRYIEKCEALLRLTSQNKSELLEQK
ncbi:MAG: hypothetical protein JW705_02105 [Methanosarcinaceae archaeon]|nr:hypothetical protein [Methanosarcinaceae archaeon]